MPSQVALTSLNSRLVLLDIMNELDLLVDPYCIVESAFYNRRNLQYKIHKVNTKNRMQVISSALRATLREYGMKGNHQKTPSGFIIFAHEDYEDMSLTSFCDSLEQYLNIPVGICTIKPPEKFIRLGGSKQDWLRVTRKALLKFKQDEIPILVCSADSAIGLNKENIRFTLHFGIPASLEEFHWQSYLAGHDGEKSDCIVIFFDLEPSIDEGVSNRMEDIVEVAEPMAQEFREFPGREMEKQVLNLVISKLLSPTSNHNTGEKVDSDLYRIFPRQIIFDKWQSESVFGM